jgi:DnaJ-class molecular chaperone
VTKRQEEIPIIIPPGIQNGEVIRMSGRGEAVARGIPGDLYVQIHVRPHAVYRREGGNLVMDLSVKLSDALLGANYSIALLDGKQHEVRIPEGVAYGDILRLKEQGIPNPGKGKKGDLLIHVRIKTPSKLSGKAKKLIEDLRKEGI